MIEMPWGYINIIIILETTHYNVDNPASKDTPILMIL